MPLVSPTLGLESFYKRTADTLMALGGLVRETEYGCEIEYEDGAEQQQVSAVSALFERDPMASRVLVLNEFWNYKMRLAEVDEWLERGKTTA